MNNSAAEAVRNVTQQIEYHNACIFYFDGLLLYKTNKKAAHDIYRDYTVKS